MFTVENLNSRGYTIEHALKRITKMEETLLITPEVLIGCLFKLPSVINVPVVFMGFDKLNPLRIPQTTFTKDVFIHMSVVQCMTNCSFEGRLILNDISFPASFPILEGSKALTMSLSTFTVYREAKRGNSTYNNQSITVLEDASMRVLLTTAFKDSCKMDFLDFLKVMEVDFLEEENKLIIAGSLPDLTGPYQFELPEHLLVKGDVVFIDEASVEVPKGCRIEGCLEIRGSY